MSFIEPNPLQATNKADGNGTITINKRPLEVYFPTSILQYVCQSYYSATLFYRRP